MRLEGPGLPYKRAMPDLMFSDKGSWIIRGIIATTGSDIVNRRRARAGAAASGSLASRVCLGGRTPKKLNVETARIG
jgi:hypothetical protein